MSSEWNRRSFLKRLGATSVGIAGVSTAGVFANDRGRNEPLERTAARQVRNFQEGLQLDPRKLVIAHADHPTRATEQAISALGGMALFVRPGESVVIKPNAAWDRTPLQAANTNPNVVATLVRLCLAAGASRVVVTDNTCNEAKRTFKRSGIREAAEKAGATVVLPDKHRFRDYDLGGVILGQMPVLSSAIETDRFINVPVAKHHGLAGFTGAMKNLYGVLGGRRNRLHQKIDDSIADLADFVRPTLTVMDATRVLLRHGPLGGNLDDTQLVGQVIASVDQVAVDAYSCSLIGLTPEDLPYLAKAEARGLGQANLENMQTIEVSG